jgi:hypothetical protein
VVEKEPQVVEPDETNNEAQGRPLCIPMLLPMHNELWLSIATICYYMTRSSMSYLFELSHLVEATTLNHCLNFFINLCLVCLDPRVELMMGFLLLARY